MSRFFVVALAIAGLALACEQADDADPCTENCGDASENPRADARASDAAGPDAARPDGASPDAAERTPDASESADGSADAGELTCAAQWAHPRLTVEAAARPASPGLELIFRYGLENQQGYITLTQAREATVVRPSDGPFSVEANAGHWAELRDAQNQTLYTRGVFQLIVESLEAPPAGDAGFVRIDQCPDFGEIRLDNLPNLAGATEVVLFQDAIDGAFGGPTVEVARFTLP